MSKMIISDLGSDELIFDFEATAINGGAGTTVTGDQWTVLQGNLYHAIEISLPDGGTLGKLYNPDGTLAYKVYEYPGITTVQSPTGKPSFTIKD